MLHILCNFRNICSYFTIVSSKKKNQIKKFGNRNLHFLKVTAITMLYVCRNLSKFVLRYSKLLVLFTSPPQHNATEKGVSPKKPHVKRNSCIIPDTFHFPLTLRDGFRRQQNNMKYNHWEV